MKPDKIRREVLRRGITSLYHFTPFSNLQSILTYGLASRRLLDDNQVAYTYSDGWRNDGQSDAVSFSIHRINETMFSKKLKTSSCAWAILEIEASFLWTHRCRFCWVNAASSEIVKHHGFIGGPWAFDEMFRDRPVSSIDPRSCRAVYQTPINMPTRNDAEVQVLSPIAPDLIRDVTVQEESHRTALAAIMRSVGRELPIEVVPEVFV
ncbi:DarT ssDNA thymidine ADP-ribosyltransferase family protein [Sedimentitalea sp. JM2-8]|uniref:DarT ssDNA thymidine ADP-ribosyltransferase family protein n=1 Tax=Sedimentitalea xiamensis TaxID=3050037 RepID=A0ABT7FL52_9RHOB|nr:DarT ssDNA thymidine ADP-ribosyltransferase family protein [Sedimentitalea xiamensis]MDK3075896.1 DarT ssDNA thymidine ADP-ribosyltransferase family protein [Sedimentitalea xiamensis]